MFENSQVGITADSDGGHSKTDTPEHGAAVAPNSKLPGKPRRGAATMRAADPVSPLSPAATTSEIVGREAGEGGVGHFGPDAQWHRADPATIDTIREYWRRRQAWHRAEKALTLQAKALCRRLAEGGDKKEADLIFSAALGKGSHPLADMALAAILPLVEAKKGIEAHRKLVEKRLSALAKTLPVAPWVKSVRGVGILSLAAIVGEAGDLSAYVNPAKLWKRMGLAVMPDGRQRRTTGAAALDHGYNPARRSVVWNIGACIVKAGGPLKQVYDARKIYEADRVETKAHAHNRAQRYVEKRFLRDLWSQWRKAGTAKDPLAPMGKAPSPPPEHRDAA